ncbi:glycosyltransferase [Candidatus Woesearchaeota archaeon]|nr:glycosyltransferase [Candidatus Woesearchaeota archaeon]
MISIIIPTYDEEKYLPRLLQCIKRQTYKDYEIIVADGDSKDKTKEIAKRYGCKVVKGIGTPSVGRNNGAEAAKGEFFVFFDADALVDKNFLQKSMQEIKKRGLDAASVRITPQSNKIIDRIFLGFFNGWITITQYFYPHAIGACIFCRKKLHDKIRGFDEKIAVAEDMDYARRCSRYGKFRILRNVKLQFCMRKYAYYGSVNVAVKILLGEIYRIFVGELKKDLFSYNSRRR